MEPTISLDSFLNFHKPQLISSGVPECFWKTIYNKIENETFNAGDAFQLLKIVYEQEKQLHEPTWGLQATSDIKKYDSEQIYLIDHAWTFRVSQAKNQLLIFDSLRDRMCNLLGLNNESTKEEIAEQVFEDLWKLCCTYSIGNAPNVNDRLPVWYVMDEIGSAVMHSDTPNCRIVPFVHVDTQITYSLLFPIADIDEGEFVYRDFAEGVTGNQRIAALLPWVPHIFDNIPFTPEIPGPEYYLSGHIEETLPDLTKFTLKTPIKEKYSVFTEYNLIKQYLTDSKFKFVNIAEEADILWFTHHFRDFLTLSQSPEKFVNQFPFEYVLTVKDLLCLTCRKCCKDHSVESLKWLPITYNLQTEVGNFVSYFQYRHMKGIENYWIVKPYNLARSLDIHITNNLNYIMRLPSSGPKIVQKYITNPVLFYRTECEFSVKFDIRYVILLQNINPLKCYVYKEFFLRFANEPFELKDFTRYEKHFTVMNYSENVTLKHMLCSEFKLKWAHQFPSFAWDDVEKSILEMFREVLKCAVKEDPPCGIAHSPQSRALYAADLMLEWTPSYDIQPKILEINWTPDCQRACEYYPNFYNDIFNLLFLNQLNESFYEL